ncbi:MAG: hypothetical protein JOS17DRAFT_59363 [Linnemannia elongata]|nr:MAG: hypothetical protein JOS17DRAFT_59363 [Linnemannia elongata]
MVHRLLFFLGLALAANEGKQKKMMERGKGLAFLFALLRSVRTSPNESNNSRVRVGQLFMLFIFMQPRLLSLIEAKSRRRSIEDDTHERKGANYTSTSLFLTANSGHNNRKERGFLLARIVKQREGRGGQ